MMLYVFVSLILVPVSLYLVKVFVAYQRVKALNLKIKGLRWLPFVLPLLVINFTVYIYQKKKQGERINQAVWYPIVNFNKTMDVIAIILNAGVAAGVYNFERRSEDIRDARRRYIDTRGNKNYAFA